MRLKRTLYSKSETTEIDINYSYHLSSALYRAIERADPSLSLELHKPSIPKLFTFSRLMIPGKKFVIEDNKIIIESDSVHFFFSTLKNNIAEKLVSGLLSKPEFKIGRSTFLISDIRVIKEKKIGKKEKFVTLSPVIVSTVEVKNGERKVVDLYTNNKKVYEILKQNLIKKYTIFYGKEPENTDVTVTPLKVKPKRIKIKDTLHRCVEMVFKAEGSEELLDVGYKAGFGGKNSMGLGMVKAV